MATRRHVCASAGEVELAALAWDYYTALLHDLDPLYEPRPQPARGTHERDSWTLIVRAVRLAMEDLAFAQPSGPAAVLLSPDQVCATLGIGKSSLWTLLRTGQIASCKIGKLRRISPASLTAYVEDKLGTGRQAQEVSRG